MGWIIGITVFCLIVVTIIYIVETEFSDTVIKFDRFLKFYALNDRRWCIECIYQNRVELISSYSSYSSDSAYFRFSFIEWIIGFEPFRIKHKKHNKHKEKMIFTSKHTVH